MADLPNPLPKYAPVGRLGRAPSTRDQERLNGVHPVLAAAIREILVEMALENRPMFVVQGVRTVQEQQALYAKGRTEAGKIVTNKDGVRHPSNHQPKQDGFGHAVDLAFLQTRDPFAEDLPWQVYGAKVEVRGLTWGGRWSHPHDCPHAELPVGIVPA